MKKKILAVFAAALLVVAVCAGTALAHTEASPTLASYLAYASPGNNAGKFKVTFLVNATESADSLGVSYIDIYTSEGSFVTTITGTTANGLVGTNNSGIAGSYTYDGTPGASYYAIVTVFAKIGSEYDSHSISTGTATTPAVPSS